MTQRKKSARKNPQKARQQGQSTRRLASMLPAQSLCWLGSFSILSSGLVFARTEPPVDRIVPTVSSSTSNRTAIAKKVNKNKDVVIKLSSTPATPKKAQSQASQTTNTLRQRLKKARKKSRTRQLANTIKLKKRNSSSTEVRKPQAKKKVTTSSAGVRTLRRKLQNRGKSPVIIRQRKPTARKNPSRSVVTQKKPQLKPKTVAPTSSAIKKKVPATQAVKKSPKVNTSASSKRKDYNNAYIDPTNYQTKLNRARYKAPSSVVVKNRITGCQAILAKGQGIASNYCKKLAGTPAKGRPSSKSKTTTRKPTPSWIRKSQGSSVAKAPTRTVKKSVAAAKSRTNRIALRKITNNANTNRRTRRLNLAATKRRHSNLRSLPSNIASAVQGQLRPNRFIPSPENFSPAIATTVNASSVAPRGGTLSAPVTAANIAPRPSVADYNIPLASVLPKILFNPVYAHNSTGLNFPLSVPARFSSLFGWRNHPITGNRRFHSGVDLAAATGTPIVASYDGVVELADWAGGYGLTVTVNHGKSKQTLYGHMSKILVRPGQVVQKGTVLGEVGSTGHSTGPHLHFELRQLTASGWVAVNPGTQLQISLNELLQRNQSAQVYRSDNQAQPN